MDRWHERGVGLLQRPGRQEFPVFDSVDPAEATVVVTRKNAQRVRVVFPQLLVVCRSSCGVSFVAVLGCLGCVLGRCRGFHMSAAVTGLCCLCLLELWHSGAGAFLRGLELSLSLRLATWCGFSCFGRAEVGRCLCGAGQLDASVTCGVARDEM